MSNASNNMTHKLNDNNEIAEGLRNHIVDEVANEDSFNTTRIINTACALLGGLVGVGITLLQSNSNKTSVGIAAGWAIGNTVGVYLDDSIHKNTERNVMSGAVSAVTTAVTTGAVGSLSNYVMDKYAKKDVIENEASTDDLQEAIITEKTIITKVIDTIKGTESFSVEQKKKVKE